MVTWCALQLVTPGPSPEPATRAPLRSLLKTQMLRPHPHVSEWHGHLTQGTHLLSGGWHCQGGDTHIGERADGGCILLGYRQAERGSPV